MFFSSGVIIDVVYRNNNHCKLLLESIQLGMLVEHDGDDEYYYVLVYFLLSLDPRDP
jgi:hypothetical protein